MTLLINTPVSATTDEDLNLDQEPKSSGKSQDELTIIQKSKYTHPSAMPDHLKENLQKENSQMPQQFIEMMRKKGVDDSENMKWQNDHVVEVNSLTQKDLHDFILHAETLGKKITYSKQTIISISN